MLTPTSIDPPPALRKRVHGSDDLVSFWAVGEQSADAIMQALGDAHQFRAVLDFGCGCGRVLHFMRGALPNARFYAADIDAEAIAYVRAAYSEVRADATPELPPLPYDDATFDLIYAVSVWTHLDVDRQHAWLAEMRRILRPGGALVASTHGRRAMEQMGLAAHWPRIAHHGVAFAATDYWRGVFPAWYGTAWHAPEYIRQAWGAYLTVCDVRVAALNDNHDLVVCRKL